MIAARPPARRSTAGGTGGAHGSRPAIVAPIVLTAFPAVVTALTATTVVVGGAMPLLLARAATRVLLDLSEATVLGILAVLLLLLRQDDARLRRLLDVAAVAAAIWTVAAATTAFLLYVGQAPPISAPAFGAGLVSFLSDVVPGRSWLVATVLAAVLTTGLVAVRSRRGLQLLTLLAVGALVPVAAQSAISDQSITGTRTAGAAALVVLIALGTWIGASAVTAGTGRSGDRARFPGIPAVCGASAAVGLALGGVQLLPLGIAVAVVLPLALGAAAAGASRHGRPLLALQPVLLGTAAGLAAAARVVQTAPAPRGTRTTPAEILTGAPLPDVPTVGRLLGGWQPDALWLLLGFALLLAYVARVVRRHRAGSHWGALRVVSWTSGVVLLVWLTSGGPAEYAPVLLSAHLAQHAAMTTAVPLLLAGGAPLRLLSPPGTGVPTARPEVGLLRRPLPAAVLAAGAFVVLYGTPLLRWSVTDAVGTEWALLQCLLTGSLLVGALMTGGRRPAILVALGLLLLETLAAAVLAVSPGLLLADRFGAMGWGTDALGDQRLGAVLAWAIAVLATLVLLGAAGRSRIDPPPPARADTAANPTPRLEVPA